MMDDDVVYVILFCHKNSRLSEHPPLFLSVWACLVCRLKNCQFNPSQSLFTFKSPHFGNGKGCEEEKERKGGWARKRIKDLEMGKVEVLWFLFLLFLLLFSSSFYFLGKKNVESNGCLSAPCLPGTNLIKV